MLCNIKLAVNAVICALIYIWVFLQKLIIYVTFDANQILVNMVTRCRHQCPLVFCWLSCNRLHVRWQGAFGWEWDSHSTWNRQRASSSSCILYCSRVHRRVRKYYVDTRNRPFRSRCVWPPIETRFSTHPLTYQIWSLSVVKVMGAVVAQPPCSDFSPCNSMTPLIESIKCYFWCNFKPWNLTSGGNVF